MGGTDIIKNVSKKVAVSVLSGFFLVFLANNSVEASSNIPIQINGLNSNISGLIEDGHTLLPLRDVTTLLGGEIQWNQADRSVTLKKGGQLIRVQIDNQVASINDHTVFLDIAPKIINEKTYAPLRFLSESLGDLVHYAPNPPSVNIKEITQNLIKFNTVKIKKETDEFVIDIQYPQINGLENKAVEQRINTVLKENLQNADDVFTDEQLQSLKQDREYLPSIKYGRYRNFKIKYNQNDILSIAFQDSVYLGGAHDSISQTAYTFNLKDGKSYQLSDLFANDTDYQTLISYAIKEALEKGGYDSFDRQFNSIDHDTKNFYLDYDGKLVIYFDAYEYTPFAAGIPEFPVDVKIHL